MPANLLFRVLSSARNGSHRKVVRASFLTVEFTFGGNNGFAIDLVSDLNLEWHVIVMLVHYFNVAQFSCKNLKVKTKVKNENKTTNESLMANLASPLTIDHFYSR